MRGSVDVKFRAVGPGWHAPYRVRYYTGERHEDGLHARLVGWGDSVEDAIANLCADPRSLVFDDLAGYLRSSLGLGSNSLSIGKEEDWRAGSTSLTEAAEFGFGGLSEELPLEAGTKRSELLCAVEDPHNLFALVQWWPRGEMIKFRAEAMALEPDLAEAYEAHLHMHRASSISRGALSHAPYPRIIEFCVPSSMVTTEVRFFYRTPEAFYFFREHNPSTSLADYDFDIPVEGVTMLL